MFTLGHRRCFAPALLTRAEGDFRFWPQSRPCAVHIPIDMLDPFSQRRVPNDVRYLASGPDTWRSRAYAAFGLDKPITFVDAHAEQSVTQPFRKYKVGDIEVFSLHA